MPNANAPHGAAAAPALDTNVSGKSYRWGRFQGWFLIILGVLLAGTMLAFLSAPDKRYIRAFAWAFAQVNDSALGLVNTGRETLSLCDVWASPPLETRNVSGALGMLVAYLIQTVGTGIGLLKKRAFGLLLLLLLTVRVIAQSYLTLIVPIALAFTLGSLPYYYKRWREFRLP